MPVFREVVEVVRRKASASGVRFDVRLRDGSPLEVREWMPRPEAAALPKVDRPRIAPRALARLHDIVSVALATMDGKGATDDDEGMRGSPEDAVRCGGQAGRAAGGGTAGAAGPAGGGADGAGGRREGDGG